MSHTYNAKNGTIFLHDNFEGRVDVEVPPWGVVERGAGFESKRFREVDYEDLLEFAEATREARAQYAKEAAEAKVDEPIAPERTYLYRLTERELFDLERERRSILEADVATLRLKVGSLERALAEAKAKVGGGP